MRYYGYETFREDMKKLHVMIDFEFDAILSIARGGYIMGHIIAEKFDNRNLLSVNVIGYDDTAKRDQLIIKNMPNLEGYERVLIVDEVVDSGRSMKLLLDRLYKDYPTKTFKSAALFYKDDALVQPDFKVNKATEWIEFFWTKDFA
jgi:xanthine phosphoribosyltransferase